MNRFGMLTASLLIALGVAAGVAVAETTTAGTSGTNAGTPATQPATDVKNTKCAVTGDDVGDSKLTATYDGKIYHFCCDSCPADFKKDPAKYAKAVADNPAKYGIKADK